MLFHSLAFLLLVAQQLSCLPIDQDKKENESKTNDFVEDIKKRIPHFPMSVKSKYVSVIPSLLAEKNEPEKNQLIQTHSTKLLPPASPDLDTADYSLAYNRGKTISSDPKDQSFKYPEIPPPEDDTILEFRESSDDNEDQLLRVRDLETTTPEEPQKGDFMNVPVVKENDGYMIDIPLAQKDGLFTSFSSVGQNRYVVKELPSVLEAEEVTNDITSEQDTTNSIESGPTSVQDADLILENLSVPGLKEVENTQDQSTRVEISPSIPGSPGLEKEESGSDTKKRDLTASGTTNIPNEDTPVGNTQSVSETGDGIAPEVLKTDSEKDQEITAEPTEINDELESQPLDFLALDPPQIVDENPIKSTSATQSASSNITPENVADPAETKDNIRADQQDIKTLTPPSSDTENSNPVPTTETAPSTDIKSESGLGPKGASDNLQTNQKDDSGSNLPISDTENPSPTAPSVIPPENDSGDMRTSDDLRANVKDISTLPISDTENPSPTAPSVITPENGSGDMRTSDLKANVKDISTLPISDTENPSPTAPSVITPENGSGDMRTTDDLKANVKDISTLPISDTENSSPMAPSVITPENGSDDMRTSDYLKANLKDISTPDPLTSDTENSDPTSPELAAPSSVTTPENGPVLTETSDNLQANEKDILASDFPISVLGNLKHTLPIPTNPSVIEPPNGSEPTETGSNIKDNGKNVSASNLSPKVTGDSNPTSPMQTAPSVLTSQKDSGPTGTSDNIEASQQDNSASNSLSSVTGDPTHTSPKPSSPSVITPENGSGTTRTSGNLPANQQDISASKPLSSDTGDLDSTSPMQTASSSLITPEIGPVPTETSDNLEANQEDILASDLPMSVSGNLKHTLPIPTTPSVIEPPNGSEPTETSGNIKDNGQNVSASNLSPTITGDSNPTSPMQTAPSVTTPQKNSGLSGTSYNFEANQHDTSASNIPSGVIGNSKPSPSVLTAPSSVTTPESGSGVTGTNDHPQSNQKNIPALILPGSIVGNPKPTSFLQTAPSVITADKGTDPVGISNSFSSNQENVSVPRWPNGAKENLSTLIFPQNSAPSNFSPKNGAEAAGPATGFNSNQQDISVSKLPVGINENLPYLNRPLNTTPSGFQSGYGAETAGLSDRFGTNRPDISVSKLPIGINENLPYFNRPMNTAPSGPSYGQGAETAESREGLNSNFRGNSIYRIPSNINGNVQYQSRPIFTAPSGFLEGNGNPTSIGPNVKTSEPYFLSQNGSAGKVNSFRGNQQGIVFSGPPNGGADSLARFSSPQKSVPSDFIQRYDAGFSGLGNGFKSNPQDFLASDRPNGVAENLTYQNSALTTNPSGFAVGNGAAIPGISNGFKTNPQYFSRPESSVPGQMTNFYYPMRTEPSRYAPEFVGGNGRFEAYRPYYSIPKLPDNQAKPANFEPSLRVEPSSYVPSRVAGSRNDFRPNQQNTLPPDSPKDVDYLPELRPPLGTSHSVYEMYNGARAPETMSGFKGNQPDFSAARPPSGFTESLNYPINSRPPTFAAPNGNTYTDNGFSTSQQRFPDYRIPTNAENLTNQKPPVYASPTGMGDSYGGQRQYYSVPRPEDNFDTNVPQPSSMPSRVPSVPVMFNWGGSTANNNESPRYQNDFSATQPASSVAENIFRSSSPERLPIVSESTKSATSPSNTYQQWIAQTGLNGSETTRLAVPEETYGTQISYPFLSQYQTQNAEAPAEINEKNQHSAASTQDSSSEDQKYFDTDQAGVNNTQKLSNDSENITKTNTREPPLASPTTDENTGQSAGLKSQESDQNAVEGIAADKTAPQNISSNETPEESGRVKNILYPKQTSQDSAPVPLSNSLSAIMHNMDQIPSAANVQVELATVAETRSESVSKNSAGPTQKTGSQPDEANAEVPETKTGPQQGVPNPETKQTNRFTETGTQPDLVDPDVTEPETNPGTRVTQSGTQPNSENPSVQDDQTGTQPNHSSNLGTQKGGQMDGEQQDPQRTQTGTQPDRVPNRTNSGIKGQDPKPYYPNVPLYQTGSMGNRPLNPSPLLMQKIFRAAGLSPEKCAYVVISRQPIGSFRSPTSQPSQQQSFYPSGGLFNFHPAPSSQFTLPSRYFGASSSPVNSQFSPMTYQPPAQHKPRPSLANPFSFLFRR